MKSTTFASYIGTGVLALSATIGQMWMVSTAGAAEAGDQPSMHISTSDLNLSKSTDVAKLYARIKTAAKQVCNDEVVTGSRLESSSKRQCMSQAVDGAVMQINNPSLSAYHKQEASKAGA
jgi:UrcA family protein